MTKMSITTKGGDKGMTSLCNGERVPKDDERVEAYGTIDECQASLGLARSLCSIEYINEKIKRIEDDLYLLMGQMALCENIESPSVEFLEDLISETTSFYGEDNFKFIRPGDSVVGASLHMARTIARRAERESLSLYRKGELDSDIFKYINRLSDAIFALILYYQKKTDDK